MIDAGFLQQRFVLAVCGQPGETIQDLVLVLREQEVTIRIYRNPKGIRQPLLLENLKPVRWCEGVKFRGLTIDDDKPVVPPRHPLCNESRTGFDSLRNIDAGNGRVVRFGSRDDGRKRNNQETQKH